MNTEIKREDDGVKGRFVIYEDGKEAGEIIYNWPAKDKFIIEHTEVGKEFGGKGYGKKLVMAAVDFARKNNVRIIPLCPYAKSVFDRDASLKDVLN